MQGSRVNIDAALAAYLFMHNSDGILEIEGLGLRPRTGASADDLGGFQLLRFERRLKITRI
jgi:hypothetical protein